LTHYPKLTLMLKSDKEKLARLPGLFAALLILFICLQVPSPAVSQTQSGSIKDGVGAGEILIGVSSASDVEARYGMKYELINKKEYSYRMEYADLGLAFYYCYKDAKKRIFLVELHHGVTSKGIIVGESTLKDVLTFYGEQSGGDADIYEYKGIQFYFEADPKPNEDKTPKLDRKVVEVDIVAPDKSSNFCD
jgi:hypothetical protein